MSKTYTKNNAVGSPVTLTLENKYYNWFAVVEYFSDAALTTPVTPSAGTVAVVGKIAGAGGNSAFQASPIDATAPGNYASAAAPLVEATVTPSGVTGASYYKVTLTGTEG